MASVSVDIIAQAIPQPGRTRNGQENAPSSADEFALLVENSVLQDQPIADPQIATAATPYVSPTDVKAAAPVAQAPNVSADLLALVEAAAVSATKPAASDPSATTISQTIQPAQPAITTDDSNKPDDTPDQTAATGTTTTSDAAVPVTLFVGLAVNAVATAPNTDQAASSGTGETIPASRSPAPIPGGTAALALARVAQDTNPAVASSVAPASGQVKQPDQIQQSQTVPAEADTSLPAPAKVDATAQVTEAPVAAAAVAFNKTTANAALDSTMTLTAPIPAAATAVESDARLQTTVNVAADTNEPVQTAVVASAVVASGLPASRETATQTSAQPAAKTSDDRATSTAKLSENEIKASDALQTRDAQPNHAAANGADTSTSTPGDNRVVAHAVTVNDNAAKPHNGPASADLTLNILPTTAPAATNAVAQLTATAANPAVTIPVAGLAVEIAANAQIGRSRFEIRLDPPELGRVDVTLDVDRQGQVTSHIIVEKPATLDLLRRDAPQLERALQDAGLKTSDSGLQFSLRDQQSQADRRDDHENGRHARSLTVIEEDAVAIPPAGRSYGRMLGASRGIDMRV